MAPEENGELACWIECVSEGLAFAFGCAGTGLVNWKVVAGGAGRLSNTEAAPNWLLKGAGLVSSSEVEPSVLLLLGKKLVQEGKLGGATGPSSSPSSSSSSSDRASPLLKNSGLSSTWLDVAVVCVKKGDDGFCPKVPFVVLIVALSGGGAKGFVMLCLEKAGASFSELLGKTEVDMLEKGVELKGLAAFCAENGELDFATTGAVNPLVLLPIKVGGFDFSDGGASKSPVVVLAADRGRDALPPCAPNSAPCSEGPPAAPYSPAVASGKLKNSSASPNRK